jgi:hypothetical protein
MADEELWRWAEPDGKQRAVSESELKEAFSKGLLSTNTPVWKRGYLDWKPASDVPELRASVVGGAKVVPPKGGLLPGQSVAQRGGAAADDEEPPSPPAYAPVPKVSAARPEAPALSFERDSAPPLPMETRGGTMPAGPMPPSDSSIVSAEASTLEVPVPVRRGASTLIIHAGAPQAEEGPPDSEGAPIIVPSPNGEQAPRAITKPPPVHEGAAAVMPEIPRSAAPTPTSPSATAAAAAQAVARVGLVKKEVPSAPKSAASAETPVRGAMVASMAAAVTGSLKSRNSVDDAWEEEPPPSSTHEINSDMILEEEQKPTAGKPSKAPVASKAPPPPKAPHKEVPPDPVSTSMILPDTNSAASGVADVSGPYAPVSMSQLLDTSSKDLAPSSAPSSFEELSADDFEPASVRSEGLTKKIEKPRTLLSKPPVLVDQTVELPALKPTAAAVVTEKPQPQPLGAMRKRQPSAPPPIPPSDPSLNADETLRLDAAHRMGLNRLPPPDIDPTQDARRSDADDTRRMPTIPPSDGRRGVAAPASSSRGVPMVALVVAVGVAAVGAYWVGKSATSGSSETTPAPTVTVVAPTVVVSSSASAPAVAKAPSACRLTGTARPVAQKAMVRSGVEVVSGVDGIAVGFASSLRDAVAMKLDPASLAPIDTAKVRGVADIRRVVPMLGTKLTPSPEYDAAALGISKKRALAGTHQSIGLIGDGFVWLKNENAAPERVFTVAGGDIDALRGVPFGTDGLAYAYRQATTVWVGTTKAGDTPQRIAGLGGQVGSPTIAALDDAAVLAWADLPKPDDTWKLRILRYVPGSAAGEPTLFKPAGGLGGSLLSPSLTRVADDRLLLLWTEEGSRNGEIGHEVRGQLLDEKAAPVGSPFTVSAPDMNAGQAQAALGLDGRGVIVFLTANGEAFDVAGAPFSCTKEATP